MEEQPYYTIPAEQVLTSLSSSLKGLTDKESESRIEHHGYNQLEDRNQISPLRIFISQFKSFVIYILFGAVVISLLLQEFIDAFAIVIILILNGVMGFIQEYKAEKSIEALQKLASTKTKVIRDGKLEEIDSKDIVPGDIISIEAGDKISCDARLIEVSQFEVDESTLTGESLPVKKNPNVIKGKLQVADRKNMVFSGTLCTSGTAKAVCTATAMETEIGRIAENINNAVETKTPLQKDLDSLGKFLGIVVIIICIIIFAVGLWGNPDALALFALGKYPEFLLAIKELFLTSVALAVAAVPEGLAIVVTIALAIGVKIMVKKNALMRKLPAVETLGCTTVICSDKTGTLTYNQMTVRKIYTDFTEFDVTGEGYSPEGEFRKEGKKIDPKILEKLLTAGCLNNNADVHDGKVVGDPTEGCLIVSSEKARLKKASLESEYRRVQDMPFDSERKMMSTLHQTSKGKVMFVKGAPEMVLAKCDRILVKGEVHKLSAKDKKIISDKNTEFAKRALRVLGFAYKEVKSDKEFTESGLVFIGLQGMIDPPRTEVKDSIKRCLTAGIRVIMVTGDHALTAKSIGERIGIEGKCVSGNDIDSINLDKEIDNISIFARVSPEHKMKIIAALQKKGNIVAMTGDGVNDAPALKKADIGIAMGITGTDVAKEASQMILTDDNFTSIVNAVEEGRGIYSNIKKFVNYMLSSNFAEVLVLFVAMIIGFKYLGVRVLPLAALQILWLNLVTDSLPALALGVDPIDSKVMDQSPRKKHAKIIDRQMLVNIIFVGVIITVAVIGLFSWGLKNYGLASAQTMALTLLVMLEIARAQMVRQQYNLGLFSNKWLLGALVLTMLLQLVLIYFTPIWKFLFGVELNNVFNVIPLGLDIWMIMIVLTAIVYAISVGFSKTLDRIVPD